MKNYFFAALSGVKIVKIRQHRGNYLFNGFLLCMCFVSNDTPIFGIVKKIIVESDLLTCYLDCDEFIGQYEDHFDAFKLLAENNVKRVRLDVLGIV